MTETGPKTIAVAIELGYPHPWHTACYEGIARYAATRGWRCVVDPYLIGMAGHLDPSRYDGVVGRISPEVGRLAAEHGLVVVNHWKNSPGRFDHTVFLDHTVSGTMVAEHLMQCGYRRFAYLGDNSDSSRHLDYSGFSERLVKAGYDAPARWDCVHDFESSLEQTIVFRRELIRWLETLRRPVGIYVLDSLTARYLMQICAEIGYHVPEDVGIVVQTSDATEHGPSAAITAIDQECFYHIGYEAARLLDELLSGKVTRQVHRLVSPSRLIKRSSTDVFICEDELVKSAMIYIAERVRETVSIQAMAEHFKVSTSTLRRRFEKAIGCSITDEIARQRIGHIQALLVESDLPLHKVAELSGFSTPAHFAEYFKRHVGTTPSEHREANLPIKMQEAPP